MPPGTQRYARTKMVLPLRLWLECDDASALQLAHTLDISPVGARLGGLRTPVQPGQTLLLQRGQLKTRFRVIWTKQLSPTEIQAGIETVEEGRKIWDLELPQQPVSDDKPPLAQPHAPSQPKAPARPAVSTARRTPPSPPRVHTQAVPKIPPSAVQAAAIAAVVLLGAVGVFAYREFYPNVAAIRVPLPAVLTAEQLDAITPKPHRETPLVPAAGIAENASLLQVAEAPQGHIPYPTPPDSSVRGKVDLKVVIATDGRVKRVLLVHGKQLLAQAAEGAIRLWRYAPHLKDGEPVEAETTVSVSFLGDDAVSVHFPKPTLAQELAN